MNKIKEIKLDQTNWLEITWVKVEEEVETILHCESFGDSDEYQELLNQRCTEFGVELSEDNLLVLSEQKAKRKVLTEEEIAEVNRLAEEQRIAGIKAEALAYLASTDWYVTRKAETSVEIPEEVSRLRAEARLVA